VNTAWARINLFLAISLQPRFSDYSGIGQYALTIDPLTGKMEWGRSRPISEKPMKQLQMKQLQRLQMRAAQQGRVGYILLWLLGVPIPLLFLVYLLRGCT